MSQACDVLIVGGGPAGSSCAWALRSSGLDVLVVDRKPFPRDKVCAGWITPQVVESLALDLDEYRGTRTCQPIRGFRTGMLGGREIETRYDHPVSYGIRRCEFDDYLLARSRVRVAEPRSIQRIERDGDGWLVDGCLRARVLVGAGGHLCPVARMLGARQHAESVVVAAQEIEFAPPAGELERGSVCEDLPELFFCNDLEGYGWCFRKGEYLNIGLGRTSHEGLTGHVRQFVEFLHERGKVRTAVPEKFHGHAYQLYERTPPELCADGVLLIGDAAGLAYPQSGEGIRPAVESGLMAAEAIVAAQGDYGLQKLDAYRLRALARFGKPRSAGPSGWLPASWLCVLARQLLANENFARRVVLERWFLHMHEPALEASSLEQPVFASHSG
jgi:geranylgeranyl reductase family protein